MKEALNHIAIIIGTILLIVIAFFVMIVITPFALVWKIWVSIALENRKARDILKGFSAYFLAIASSIDKFGNCAFGGFLSWLFLKENKYPFGNNYETVSEVMGWAQMYNDLNRKGLFLLALLNMIENEHCEKARVIGLNRAIKKVAL